MVKLSRSNIKDFLIAIGITCFFPIFKKYVSVVTIFINKLSSIYYNNTYAKMYLDCAFECYFYVQKIIFRKNTEPWYNPWVCVCYMRQNCFTSNYHNISVNSYYLNQLYTIFDPTQINIFGNLPKPQISNTTESPSHSEGLSLHQFVCDVYNTCNFLKITYFNYGYEFLVIMKTKDMYISRIGYSKNNKNLRLDEIHTNKGDHSILMVEYLHSDMVSPISLNIPKGFFVENNEILSPMFIKRMLVLNNRPFIFDLNYKLRIMDKYIKYHTINSSNFVIVKKSGFEIVSFDSFVSQDMGAEENTNEIGGNFPTSGERSSEAFPHFRDVPEINSNDDIRENFTF